MAANYEVRTNNYKAEVDHFTDRLEKTWTGNELYASAYADDGKYADKIMYISAAKYANARNASDFRHEITNQSAILFDEAGPFAEAKAHVTDEDRFFEIPEEVFN